MKIFSPTDLSFLLPQSHILDVLGRERELSKTFEKVNMGKSGSSHFRDPSLISEESPLKSEAMLIKYLLFWDP